MGEKETEMENGRLVQLISQGEVLWKGMNEINDLFNGKRSWRRTVEKKVKDRGMWS